MILNALSLNALHRLRDQWIKAKHKVSISLKPVANESMGAFQERYLAHLAKAHEKPNKAIAAIDAQIASRQGEPVRSSLPKKQQRKLGMREAV